MPRYMLMKKLYFEAATFIETAEAHLCVSEIVSSPMYAYYL